MPEIEVYFLAFYILGASQRFVMYVQVTRYTERIEIMENVRAFMEEDVGGFVNETIIRPPESDVFDVD